MICYYFALNDLMIKHVKGIKIKPIVNGKNQTPSPADCPQVF